VYLLRLVHVQVVLFPDFAEGLYADGEFFHGMRIECEQR
jgi:hypothetical protein